MKVKNWCGVSGIYASEGAMVLEFNVMSAHQGPSSRRRPGSSPIQIIGSTSGLDSGLRRNDEFVMVQEAPISFVDINRRERD